MQLVLNIRKDLHYTRSSTAEINDWRVQQHTVHTAAFLQTALLTNRSSTTAQVLRTNSRGENSTLLGNPNPKPLLCSAAWREQPALTLLHTEAGPGAHPGAL